MKIRSIVSLLLAFVLLLTGCSKTPQNGDDDGEKTSAAALSVSDSEEMIQTSDTKQEETQAVDTKREETEAADITTADITAESTAQTDEPVVSPDYDPAFFQNDLFIGDSISTGLFLYGYLDKANVFAEVGLNPESAAYREVDGVTCVQKAQDMNPKRIYIMLGTNGLAFLDPDYMATKITELIEMLEMACPTAQICIISISPVTKAHDAEGAETMDKVNAYNKALETICTAGGYRFIDLCSLLKDSDGYFSEDYAEADGLHFKGNTYKLLLNTVQNAV